MPAPVYTVGTNIGDLTNHTLLAAACHLGKVKLICNNPDAVKKLWVARSSTLTKGKKEERERDNVCERERNVFTGNRVAL